MLGSDNESYIGLIKHLCSVGEINIYVGYGLELENADVGVEEVNVNDSGFNVEEVEVDVDDGPNAGPSADPELPMEPSPSQAGPSAASVSGSTGVAGSTRLETDNVEVGVEDINEGRADNDDESDDDSDVGT
ncbi:hypothetical protein V6N12_033071 [Hibiscus sabdariffa]|uniref:Uncharacterized protein n=1 Tax=Hibiscus sabdariffa TaxID=183260 RepID=A0ABR2BEH1_9ROSI